MADSARIEVRLLGPVEVTVDGAPVPLGPARQRTVLAALAADAGKPVAVPTLIERVWGEDPPEQVRTVVYSYVARLRRVLREAGDDRVRLQRRPGGYAFEADPDVVDLIRFARLVRDPDPETVAGVLALWRGPALADLAGEWVERTRHRAEQQRLDALLSWGRARLAAGHPDPVIDALREPVARHPLVEPLAALLIDALHSAGRTAEALDRYAGVRRHLIESLGTEPGHELRELHRTLLTDSEPPRRPSTLPADTGAFTGRSAEIDRLRSSLDPGVALVHAIAGMPGVGKTALAVHAAHRLRESFPDGQVFVDLHGHTAGRPPAEPADVLATLLAADGVDPRRLPAGVEERSALWRSRLAGRRTLVILDNALNSAQVSPLLPGQPGSLALITSRRFLGDLPSDAVPVSLDVLTPDEGVRMFRRLAPPDADAPALVDACGCLPLAIALLARVLRRHPRWTAADVLTEQLLDASAENASVAAAFDLSYRLLPPDRQRLFRLLALHPGSEIEPHAAAALAGITVEAATAALDALQADSLLIEVGHRRYAMHDLLRSYARRLTDDATDALDRLLDHYARTAADASARVGRPRRRSEQRNLGLALAWMRAERDNLLACLDVATDPRRLVALTAGCAELLRRDVPWDQALRRHDAAVAAAERIGHGLAGALADRATVRRLLGDYPAAEADSRRAVELHHARGDRLGEADALTNLAKALSRASDYPRSVEVIGRALELYRALDDPAGEADALVELGVARGMMSDFQAAQELLRTALDLYSDLGDCSGQAYALRILGIAHGRVGDFAGAATLLGRSLELYQELGAQVGEALTLTDLGRVAVGRGDHRAAVEALRQAVARHRVIHHRIGESAALLYLGGALRRAGDLVGAAEALESALVVDREIGNRSGEVMVLNELGSVYRQRGDLTGAVAAHRAALALADQVPSPWDRAQSLAGLGRCAAARGRPRDGAAQLRTALGILRRIHAAEATEVAADLAAIQERSS